jgi:predicted permease
MGLLDWLARRRREADLQDEIRAHLAMATRDCIDRGDAAEQARRAARREFGNVILTREATRLAWGGSWRERLADWAHDVGYACRTLVRSPGYSLVVMLVLTLGIGANVAVFSLFKSVALKPLPGVRDSGRLGVLVARTGAGRIVPLPYLDFNDLSSPQTTFAALAGVSQIALGLGLTTGGERVIAELVTGNYFQVLEVGAQLGRTLPPSDADAPGRQPVVVLSDAMWRRVLGADPAIVGTAIQLNGQFLTVVGVAQPRFQGTIVSMVTDVFVPVTMQPLLQQQNVLSSRTVPLMWGLGRVRPGATIADAAAEADVIWSQIASAHGTTSNDRRATVVPLWQSPFGAQTYMLPAVLAMGAMGALLLLIVCANVANLVLVRGMARRGEIAARLALGASRGRILRLLIIESLVLSAPGGAAGVLLAATLLPLASTVADTSSAGFGQSYLDTSIDGFVIAFAVLLSCGSALVFGFAPAWRSARLDLASIMKDDLSPRSGSRGPVRSALVVSQVAVSLLLLVAAALVVRSFDAARRGDAGFDTQQVAVVALDTRGAGYDDERGRAFYRRLLDIVRADPSVEGASLGERGLLTLVDGRSREVAIDGYVKHENDDTLFLVDIIAGDYFRTLGIPMRAGRDFDARDDRPGRRVAIVNETLARRFWGSAPNALERRVQVSESGWITVVGVVRDIKYARMTEDPRPHVYLPFEQFFASGLRLHVRSSRLSPAALIETVRMRVRSVDPAMPIVSSQMLEDQTRLSLGVFLMAAVMLAVFGGIAVALSALGTYGLVSYSVQQSTHEIGIRIAIGASRADVARRFVRRGLRLGGVGIACGLLASLVLARGLSGVLYGVSATDLPSFATAAVAVLAIVAFASAIPAWRASRLDPIAALRHH